MLNKIYVALLKYNLFLYYYLFQFKYHAKKYRSSKRTGFLILLMCCACDAVRSQAWRQGKIKDRMSQLMRLWYLSHRRPAKAQASLCIRAVSPEYSLSVRRNIGPLTTYWAHSEDSDQTGLMPRVICVFAWRTCHFVGFVVRQLNYNDVKKKRFIENVAQHATGTSYFGGKVFYLYFWLCFS